MYWRILRSKERKREIEVREMGEKKAGTTDDTRDLIGREINISLWEVKGHWKETTEAL